MAKSEFFTREYSGGGASIVIGEDDGFTAVSISVTGTGATSATVQGTLKLDGNTSSTISIASGESLTISTNDGKVLDGLTIIRAGSSDNTTRIIARQ